MTLKPIKDYPNYRVDTENHVVYSVRYGIIKPLQTHRPWNEVNICRNSKTKRLTIQRLMWCANHGVSPDAIPQGYVFSRDGHVTTRTDLMREVVKTKRHKTDCESALRLIDAYKRNDITAYMTEVYKQSQAVESFIAEHYRYSAVTIADALCKAVESIEQRFQDGNIVLDVFGFIKHYFFTLMQARRRRKREYNDNCNYEEIEL